MKEERITQLIKTRIEESKKLKRVNDEIERLSQLERQILDRILTLDSQIALG